MNIQFNITLRVIFDQIEGKVAGLNKKHFVIYYSCKKIFEIFFFFFFSFIKNFLKHKKMLKKNKKIKKKQRIHIDAPIILIIHQYISYLIYSEKMAITKCKKYIPS